jgi:aminoglycoside 6'-N-acetyltransferase
MHRWLNLPHVAEWWGPEDGSGPSFEEVAHEYGEYVDGIEPIHPYLVLDDDVPIGHLQWMQYRDYPAYARILGIDDPGAANCDVFIGDAAFLHRGLGGPLVRQFVLEIIFASGSVTTCFIDPDATNAIAIRAYEKAGFRFVRHVDDDGEGNSIRVMEMMRAT